jgi:DNA-binding transcriptional ArsR family regulator
VTCDEVAEPRERIMKTIEAVPGINRSGIMRATGLSWGSVGRHLNALRKYRRIELITVGRSLRAAPVAFAHQIPNHDALMVQLARKTLQSLDLHAAQGPAQLSRFIASTPRRVSAQLAILSQAGLIQKNTSYHPSFSLTDEGGRMATSLEKRAAARTSERNDAPGDGETNPRMQGAPRSGRSEPNITNRP